MISLKDLKDHRAHFNKTWKKTWWKKFKFSSNEDLCIFPRGDYNKITTIHWLNLNIFSRTNLPTSTKLDTKLSWVKRTQDCTNSECSVSNEESFKQFIHVRFYWIKQVEKQNVYGPHRSPEKTVYINKHKWWKSLRWLRKKNYYLLIDNWMALHLNKLESPSSKDDLSQI